MSRNFNVKKNQIERRTGLMYEEFFPRACAPCSSETFSAVWRRTLKYSNMFDNGRKVKRLNMMKVLRQEERKYHIAHGHLKLAAGKKMMKISAAILEASRFISDEELKEEFELSRTLTDDDDIIATIIGGERRSSELPNAPEQAKLRMRAVSVVLRKLPPHFLAQYEATRMTNNETSLDDQLQVTKSLVNVRVMVEKLPFRTVKKYFK